VSDSPQGPGWWQASDGKWYPPEQAPGGGAAGGGAAGGGAAGGEGGLAHLNVGDAFSYGWNKYSQNVGQLILAAIVGWAIAAVLIVIGYVVLLATALAGSDPADCSFNEAGNFRCTGGGGPSFILIVLGFGIFFFLLFLGQSIFEMFMVRAGLITTAGEPIETGKILSTDNLGPYLGAVVLMALITGIGFVLCYVPGIIAWIFFLTFGRFFGFFILDKGMGSIEGIKASITMVRQNLGNILLFLIAALVINWIGAAICFIGLLVTIPLTAIAAAYVYRQAQGQPIAA
jgi:uncharacterized membrane protein